MTQVQAVRRRIIEAANAEWVNAAAAAMSWPRAAVIEALDAMGGNVVATSDMMHDFCAYHDHTELTGDDHVNFLRYLRARLSDARTP